MTSSPSRLRRWLRRIVRVAATAALLVTLFLVAGLAIDVGSIRGLRERAERAGSNYLHRPMHIGRIGIHLARGHFVVENLVIEGLTGEAAPFFKAKRIEVSLPWWNLLWKRQVLIESVELSDWEMTVEMFPNGRHSVPKFGSGVSGPRRFTTRLTYVHAYRGQFSYLDHGDWSTIARNLDVTVMNPGRYTGYASFSHGTTQIRKYLPMRTDMECRFTIDGGQVHLSRIDLTSDGAKSFVQGDVDFRPGRWPEMLYQVKSRVHFPTMKEIFFAGQRFTVNGDGDFAGTFHISKAGTALKGDFTSDLVHLNAFAFPRLAGSLTWLSDRLDVYNASSEFYGGRTRFRYLLAPLGSPRPTVSRLEVTYEHVDLAPLSDFLQTKGLRLAGRATGTHVLEYPLGRFAQHKGEGRLTVQPPAGVGLFSRAAPIPAATYRPASAIVEEGAELPPPLGYVPVGGEMAYRYDADWVTLEPGWFATPTTYVEFRGRTAYTEHATIPFYARSADWQESDRLLAGVLTAFGSPTGTVLVGGYGEFDGVMLNSFRRPRIEGRFTGDQLEAWKVIWGQASGNVVVENGYVDVTDGVAAMPGSEIRADGRFSLSYPRKDGGEEINARVRMVDRPLRDLRHAFELDAYPLDGKVSGEYHLYGRYKRPFGFGKMTLTDGVAYGEPIDRATGSLRFEGVGTRLDGIEMRKSGGTITGAAYVTWDGRYSFNVDARRIPMESVVFVNYPRAPLSGLMSFSASGSGAFASPAYEITRIFVSDLFVSDEGIGQVTGRIAVRDEIMTVELDAASSRLQVTGNGRISLASELDGDLFFRFSDTSLDPYIRAFEPRLSPFTSAIASGTVKVVGKLTDPERLLVEGNVERLDLRLFDYPVRNEKPIQLAFDRKTIRLNAMRLVGEDTSLDLFGAINLDNREISAQAKGAANLKILQAAFRDIRSAGRAEVAADIIGPLADPVLSGSASIGDGRIRYFSLPHSIDAINGRVKFRRGAITVDEVQPLVAQVGGGRVTFGGQIDLDGFVPRRLNLTAVGGGLRLRVPEGFTTIVDVPELALIGPFASPTVKGTINVRSSISRRRVDIDTGLLQIAALAASARAATPPPAPTQPTLPVTFDIRVVAVSSVRVENNFANLVASADLTLRGTLDHPLIFGRAQIDRGDALFEGKRYVITQGIVDFINPNRIEPIVDFEAETRVRAPGQTYVVDARAFGRWPNQLSFQLTSDPPLPRVDVLALLFSDVSALQDADIRALERPGAAQEDLVRARLAQALASPVAGNVGRFIERTVGLDTVQITPSFVDPYQQRYPTARLTIGKRLSNRVYLTFSQNLSSPADQTIWLVEYDATERVAWVLSKNEDSTYAVDVRVRHVF